MARYVLFFLFALVAWQSLELLLGLLLSLAGGHCEIRVIGQGRMELEGEVELRRGDRVGGWEKEQERGDTVYKGPRDLSSTGNGEREGEKKVTTCG